MAKSTMSDVIDVVRRFTKLGLKHKLEAWKAIYADMEEAKAKGKKVTKKPPEGAA